MQRTERREEINIQDGILFGWLKERTQLTFELTTGRSITGRVERFDRHCVLMRDESDQQQLVYKHALASVCPVPASLTWRGRDTADRIRRRTPRAALAEPGRVRMVDGGDRSRWEETPCLP